MPKRKSTARKASRPKRPYYRGKGAYRAPRSASYGVSVGRALGSALSLSPKTAALAPLASAALGKAGGWLGDKLGTYFGWGSYSVKNNSLVAEGNAPLAMHGKGATFRLTKREYIGDIYSSGTIGAFKSQTFQLNPGNAQLMPWTSGFASGFQKYRLLGAIFQYKSEVGDSTGQLNTALGVVAMASNYNAADQDFPNMQAMCNSQYSTSEKPSTSMVHIVECDPALQSQKSLYVTPGGVPRAGMSINECNWLKFAIASEGIPAANVRLGQLWITYDLEFIQTIDNGLQMNTRTDTFTNGTGITGTNPLGSTSNVQKAVNNSIGGRIVNGTTYAFPELLQQGTYLVTYYLNQTAGIWTAPTLTGTNCVLFNFSPGVPAIACPENGEGAIQFASVTYGFRVTGQNATISFSGTAMGAGAIGIIFVVTALDGDVLAAGMSAQ